MTTRTIRSGWLRCSGDGCHNCGGRHDVLGVCFKPDGVYFLDVVPDPDATWQGCTEYESEEEEKPMHGHNWTNGRHDVMTGYWMVAIILVVVFLIGKCLMG